MSCIPALAPCPHCGSSEVEAVLTFAEGYNEDAAVKCGDCGARGPEAHHTHRTGDNSDAARIKAAKAWNRRNEPATQSEPDTPQTRQIRGKTYHRMDMDLIAQRCEIRGWNHSDALFGDDAGYVEVKSPDFSCAIDFFVEDGHRWAGPWFPSGLAFLLEPRWTIESLCSSPPSGWAAHRSGEKVCFVRAGGANARVLYSPHYKCIYTAWTTHYPLIEAKDVSDAQYDDHLKGCIEDHRGMVDLLELLAEIK